MAGYWLVKQEPTTYSFAQLQKDRRTTWDGVRNFQARNNLRAMAVGDAVLFYHSNVGPGVVGVCEVAKAAYPDPTAKEGAWVAVDLVPTKALRRPVTLDEIRRTPKLKDIALLRQSRLSVMPLTRVEFETIVQLGG